MNVKITYQPLTFGPWKWHLSRETAPGEWHIDASSIFRCQLDKNLKADDVLVHEDKGEPDPPRNADGSLTYYKEASDRTSYTYIHIPAEDL